MTEANKNLNETTESKVESNVQNESRYARQVRFPAIGEAGQQQIQNSQVLLIGCGALGSVIANTLTRAGVGKLRIVDRDFLEKSNLQRQVLYDEQDVANGLPKAIAAANKLRQINSEVIIEPIVADVDASNIESLLSRIESPGLPGQQASNPPIPSTLGQPGANQKQHVDMILDGSDNFEIRFLINDAAVKHSIPWVYGGCLGADGQTMTIVPGETACLNCLMLDGPPPPGTTPTCDSFGILAPIINVVASFQANEALKILSGNQAAINRKLNVFSMWENENRQLDISKLRDKVDCPTCKQHLFEWLSGQRGSHSAVLCGRNAVQLSFPDRQSVSLGELEGRLKPLGRVQSNSFLLRFHVDEFVITVFPDGRAIIGGTENIAVARKLYAQYLGS